MVTLCFEVLATIPQAQFNVWIIYVCMFVLHCITDCIWQVTAASKFQFTYYRRQGPHHIPCKGQDWICFPHVHRTKPSSAICAVVSLSLVDSCWYLCSSWCRCCCCCCLWLCSDFLTPCDSPNAKHVWSPSQIKQRGSVLVTRYPSLGMCLS